MSALSQGHIGLSQKPSQYTPVVFVMVFSVIYGVGQWFYFTVPDELLRSSVYPILFTQPTIALIKLFAPNSLVVSHDTSIWSPSHAVEVVRGCDGFGFLWLLWSALLAFRMTAGGQWWRSLLHCLLGGSLLFVCNQVRLVLLFFCLQYTPGWFSMLHLYVLPLTMAGVCLLIFLRCIQLISRPTLVAHDYPSTNL